MIKDHLELATSIGLTQNPEESEYDFRKRVFMEVYPDDAMQAIEILFCIEHFSGLTERDMIYIPMARSLYEKDENGLQKFVNGFSTDPSIPYRKSEVKRPIDIIREMNPGVFIPTGEELANILKNK